MIYGTRCTLCRGVVSLRFSDLEISQSCIYCITQNRASNYLIRTHTWHAVYPPSIALTIVAVDLQRAPAHHLHLDRLERSVPCCGYSRKDNWFGSAISFARSSRYISRYASLTSFGGGTIPRVDLIFVKNAFGAHGRTSACVRASPSSFFYRIIYSVNYRNDHLCRALLHIIIKDEKKKTKMTRSICCMIERICIMFIMHLTSFSKCKIFSDLIDFDITFGSL